MTHFRPVLTALVCSVSLLTGCTAVPVATISAAAGAAAATTEVTSAVYKMGKLRAAEMATDERIRAAIYTAIVELSYAIKQDTGNSKIVVVDDRGNKVVFTITSITKTACTLQIDVGLFGQQHVARLIYERISVALAELRKSG